MFFDSLGETDGKSVIEPSLPQNRIENYITWKSGRRMRPTLVIWIWRDFSKFCPPKRLVRGLLLTTEESLPLLARDSWMSRRFSSVRCSVLRSVTICTFAALHTCRKKKQQGALSQKKHMDSHSYGKAEITMKFVLTWRNIHCLSCNKSGLDTT